MPVDQRLADMIALERQVREMRDDVARRTGGGAGDSGAGGGMDPWQTTVETRLGQLHNDNGDLRKELTDFRRDVQTQFNFVLGAMAVGFITLAGMMIAGYLKLADAIDAIGK